MKKRLLTILAIVALCVGVASAQGRKSIRINEVMVKNDSSVVDDYGVRTAWIELFNANFAPVDIASIYVTNDKSNKTLYQIPKGSEATHMGKRQHTLLWADGKANHGPMHLSFKLRPDTVNYIAIYDADGSTLIDEVVIPADLKAGYSYARMTDGSDNWEVRTDTTTINAITPGFPNVVREGNSKAARFAETDENGFGLSLMAMCIVFSALLLLCLCFYGIGTVNKIVSRRNKARAQASIAPATSADGQKKVRTDNDSGEVIAAITAALHQHFNVHDQENTVLTINKVKRAYSPWSSKIYGLRELPHR